MVLTLSPDVATAADLLARHPAALRGLWLHDPDGTTAESLLSALRPLFGSVRILPLNIDEDGLLGGTDVAASLAAGRPVARSGLLAEVQGGLLVVRGAERLRPGLAATIAAALDSSPMSLLLLGSDPDQRPPQILLDRVAFHLRADADAAPSDPLPEGDAPLRLLAGLSAALGVNSARALNFAAAAYRTSGDLLPAIRLVLAPRATRLPPAPEPPAPENDSTPTPEAREQPLEDVVLEAAKAALPADILAALIDGRTRSATTAGTGGMRRRSPLRGRPIGSRAGLPRGGQRLALIETLRAAAPWQGIRGRGHGDPVRLRRDDLRIRRFEDRSSALAIFAVDASGSAARARLAEAKGAVELLLARAYAKRLEVSLLAFRKDAAELLLPPTRSLTRARRALAELPGGGGTPMAAGIALAATLADSARRRGSTPHVVLLTDGRANIAADGTPERARADADALAAGRALAATGTQATLIDIGPRPQPEAARLADAMRAKNVHLPRGDAQALATAISV